MWLETSPHWSQEVSDRLGTPVAQKSPLDPAHIVSVWSTTQTGSSFLVYQQGWETEAAWVVCGLTRSLGKPGRAFALDWDDFGIASLPLLLSSWMRGRDWVHHQLGRGEKRSLGKESGQKGFPIFFLGVCRSLMLTWDYFSFVQTEELLGWDN